MSASATQRVHNNSVGHNSPMARKRHRGLMCTKFGTVVGAADIITCDNFLAMVADYVGGRKLSFPTSQSPLGWCYRAAVMC